MNIIKDIIIFYRIPIMRWFTFIFLFLCLLAPALAQQDNETGDEDIKTLSTLQALVSSLDQLEQEIHQYRNQLKSQTGDKPIEELQKSIVAALAEKEKLQQTFEEIACGLDLETFEQKLQSQFDWAKELKDLLSPILGELRTVTDRPRELERLKREVAYYESRIPIIQKSLARLAQIRTDVAYLAHTPQGNMLTVRLEDLEKEWRDKLQQTKSNLAASELQLNEKLEERKSLVNSARDLFANFFRSRGLNLIVALAVFIIILVGSRYLYRMIDRVSPWHREKKHRKFWARFLDVLYFALTFIGSIISALIVLYLLEDWVSTRRGPDHAFGSGLGCPQGTPRCLAAGPVDAEPGLGERRGNPDPQRVALDGGNDQCLHLSGQSIA